MELTSKFLGKEFEGFKVVRYFVKNKYKKVYGNPKQKDHRAYSYELYNETTKQHLTISGNQLRLLNDGRRTISQMLSIDSRGGYKNPQINAYKKWLKTQK